MSLQMRFQLIKDFLGVSHTDVFDPVVLIRFTPSVQFKASVSLP